jgi:hypothetical protein
MQVQRGDFMREREKEQGTSDVRFGGKRGAKD